VDHVLCGKSTARGDHGLALREAADLAHNPAALRENRGPSRAVNRPIDATAAEQRRVRRVHDGIGRFFCEIGRAMDIDRLAASE
jgi:hypothetical protein